MEITKEQKEKIISDISWDYVNSYNKNHTGNNDIDTLFDFGSLGLLTPRELCGMFVNETLERYNKE